jgi:hypothetical protein
LTTRYSNAVSDLPARNLPVLGILIKSYRGDLERAEELCQSLGLFNADNLPIWIVVPEQDLSDFTACASECSATLLSESLFSHHLTEVPVSGIRPGYINQEIIKLAFWELGLVENYLPIDSDAVVLRPFGKSDLMFDSETPFTVLLEDNDLKIDPKYYSENWEGRENSLREIKSFLNFEDPRILTCHGHQVLSTKVLKSFKEQILVPRGLDYRDILEIAPYEFSWYNFWLQKSREMPIHQREPYFKVIHSSEQHLEVTLKGITMKDISRAYIGVVINSNFSKSWGKVDTHETKTTTLARYLTWSELFGTLKTKSQDAIKFRLINRKNTK